MASQVFCRLCSTEKPPSEALFCVTCKEILCTTCFIFEHHKRAGGGNGGVFHDHSKLLDGPPGEWAMSQLHKAECHVSETAEAINTQLELKLASLKHKCLEEFDLLMQKQQDAILQQQALVHNRFGISVVREPPADLAMVAVKNGAAISASCAADGGDKLKLRQFLEDARLGGVVVDDAALEDAVAKAESRLLMEVESLLQIFRSAAMPTAASDHSLNINDEVSTADQRAVAASSSSVAMETKVKEDAAPSPAKDPSPQSSIVVVNHVTVESPTNLVTESGLDSGSVVLSEAGAAASLATVLLKGVAPKLKRGPGRTSTKQLQQVGAVASTSSVPKLKQPKKKIGRSKHKRFTHRKKSTVAISGHSESFPMETDEDIGLPLKAIGGAAVRGMAAVPVLENEELSDLPSDSDSEDDVALRELVDKKGRFKQRPSFLGSGPSRLMSASCSAAGKILRKVRNRKKDVTPAEVSGRSHLTRKCALKKRRKYQYPRTPKVPRSKRRRAALAHDETASSLAPDDHFAEILNSVVDSVAAGSMLDTGKAKPAAKRLTRFIHCQLCKKRVSSSKQSFHCREHSNHVQYRCNLCGSGSKAWGPSKVKRHIRSRHPEADASDPLHVIDDGPVSKASLDDLLKQCFPIRNIPLKPAQFDNSLNDGSTSNDPDIDLESVETIVDLTQSSPSHSSPSPNAVDTANPIDVIGAIESGSLHSESRVNNGSLHSESAAASAKPIEANVPGTSSSRTRALPAARGKMMIGIRSGPITPRIQRAILQQQINNLQKQAAATNSRAGEPADSTSAGPSQSGTGSASLSDQHAGDLTAGEIPTLVVKQEKEESSDKMSNLFERIAPGAEPGGTEDIVRAAASQFEADTKTDEFKRYRKGARVLAFYQSDPPKTYYPGHVESIDGRKYYVSFPNSDKRTRTDDLVHLSQIKPGCKVSFGTHQEDIRGERFIEVYRGEVLKAPNIKEPLSWFKGEFLIEKEDGVEVTVPWTSLLLQTKTQYESFFKEKGGHLLEHDTAYITEEPRQRKAPDLFQVGVACGLDHGGHGKRASVSPRKHGSKKPKADVSAEKTLAVGENEADGSLALDERSVSLPDEPQPDPELPKAETP